MSEDDEEEAPPISAPKVGSNRISPEKDVELVHYLNGKATSENDACMVCGSWKNTITQMTFSLDAQPEEGAIASGQQMPLYVTQCHNCGFVRSFNSIIVDRNIQNEGFDSQASNFLKKDEEDAS